MVIYVIVYIYIYICVYIYLCMRIYIYVYILPIAFNTVYDGVSEFLRNQLLNARTVEISKDRQRLLFWFTAASGPNLTGGNKTIKQQGTPDWVSQGELPLPVLPCVLAVSVTPSIIGLPPGLRFGDTTRCLLSCFIFYFCVHALPKLYNGSGVAKQASRTARTARRGLRLLRRKSDLWAALFVGSTTFSFTAPF